MLISDVFPFELSEEVPFRSRDDLTAQAMPGPSSDLRRLTSVCLMQGTTAVWVIEYRVKRRDLGGLPSVAPRVSESNLLAAEVFFKPGPFGLRGILGIPLPRRLPVAI